MRDRWKDALAALEGALERKAGDERGFALSFHVEIVGDAAVFVTAWVQRIGKRGKAGVPRRLSRRRLLVEHGAALSPEDARVVAALPEHDVPASRALLEALVDHPRVVLHADPERAVRIERVPLGLVAEDRQGAVRVTAGIEGAALPPAILERVRRARPEDVSFLWDGARITLLDVRPELRAALAVLSAESTTLFPPESHAALLAALSRWARHVPVAMPRSVLGQSVAPAHLWVLRLRGEPGGALDVELLIRALRDGPPHTPGLGARDVHVRRGELALHTVRDLAAERIAADALVRRLSLDAAEPGHDPFRYRFPHVGEALAFVEEVSRLDPPPELEWVGKPLRLAGVATAASLKVTIDRRRTWFGVLGDLTVGSERVQLARLLDAARREERFVEVEPLTFVEIAGVLRERLARLADHAHHGKRGVEVGPSAAAALLRLEHAGAIVEADAPFRTLASRVTAAATLDVEVPPTLAATLRPYQREGFVWLMRLAAWGAGAVLADDMGLGKTVQALAVTIARASLGPAIVVAPTSVAFNWIDEAARFAPGLRVVAYGEADAREAVLASLGPGDVLVVSYGLLVRDVEKIARVAFATAIFDEAQHLKNANTQRARAARALSASFLFALSGTPIENHLGELWSLFATVFPSLLGSWDTFRERHASPIEKGIDPEAAPALGRVIAPFLLRRTKAAVEAELPPRIDVRVPVLLSGAEWQLYEDARLTALSDLGKPKAGLAPDQRRVHVLAALTRLRLCASHPRLYDARSDVTSSKLARFLELVDELVSEGQRALVFSQFTSHLALARQALDARGVRHVYLDGETPPRERKERVATFQEGDAPLFLISLKAGGFGLNLTAATNVIHLDPWWNPATEDQASDRAHRIGQTRPVTVYRLVAIGTIEEKMAAVHGEKRALVNTILEGKGAVGALSVDELVSLLGPSAPIDVRAAAGTIEPISTTIVGKVRAAET